MIILLLIKNPGTWEFSKSINNNEIFNNSYAVIILTEWEEYRKLNWKSIAKKMVPPAWVFDSRSIVNTNEVKMQVLDYGDLVMAFRISNSEIIFLK